MNDAPRYTRRNVLGGAAAVGAGALITPGAALGRARTAGSAGTAGSVFSRRIGTVTGTSPVIAAPRRFVLAGVQWSQPADGRIEMRARARGGRWSPWALASVRGHGPDRPAAAEEGLYGEPLWFGSEDEVQLRSAGVASGVTLHFVAGATPSPASAADAARTTQAATAAALPLAQPVLPAGPGQPPIIARSAWAGRDHGPTDGPYYGAIDLAFVHHTVNPNGYAAAQVPQLILAIYDYHRYTRGFYDIAYNFVIDRYGRIWEARAGGIDEPVVGAHAGGYNSVSTGVALLGTFMVSEPPPAALTALEQLLAWKLPLHGLPALGKVRVEVDPADAFYTPFRPGQRVLLPRIAGHRDGDLTDCPGNDLYARLPTVRTRVAALTGIPLQLTLAASTAIVAAGAAVGLSGRLTQLDGAALPGAPLQIQTVSGVGVTTTLATVTTAADGTWSTTLALSHSVVVRALHAAAPAAVSNLVVVGVTPALALTLVSAAPLRVRGTIAPAKAGVTIAVYKRTGTGRTLVLTRQVVARRGAFTARLDLGARAHGDYVIVARTGADALSAAGASAPLAVTLA